ncbi:alpha/beta hydrolase [Mycolicibacterium insubricum]|uniref:Alpha/beta hydrolase n=1 Tax=Mycolicibacterium insubricum TaxID=444597 RepID=A0A1X0DHJ6_9MYCO|nr:alpha/beta fold hydrolase [Mycolicibacterium insubricum]MCB9440652.1 alpha/beta fold hydrolase [Mycolicibacterium sp.]MCV7082525.1 alpha/beta fold hydrolase [Mycolicibacterium insubricum]ORA71787.1 alpha/beta hydrolase [Mycolicibacterium insubricum]BBZ65591.1 alpha/beta hydrolase [Mycolicibacterium insubricum]
MEQYRNGELVFDVIDRGPADGPVVILLHGFPQTNASWAPVMDRLVAAGYRCVAPNLRGYSPGARPKGRRHYRASLLAGDVVALIDALGVDTVHLVGHDWGALVAWAVGAEAPQRLASLTAVSVPHPAAFLSAVLTSRQALASTYMGVFQLPVLPERYLLGKNRDGAPLAAALVSAGQSRAAAERDAASMTEPGRLTAALNYYRALPLTDPRAARSPITAPTLYIWSEDDVALKEKGARLCGRYVDGPYRYERMPGSHWLPDECPDTIADLLIDWFGSHPVSR